jgi:ABC-2 type transport system ATP-binding protein
VPAVEVDDLVVRYGDLVAVDHVSFCAEAGAITAVLGPNGAGKTSTIEVCEGYRRATAGTVRVLGFDPGTQQRRLSERIGVMLQEGGVYPGARGIKIFPDKRIIIGNMLPQLIVKISGYFCDHGGINAV